MGWARERFTSCYTPDSSLTCAICVGVIQEAVATTCGHTFCSKCLETWLEKGRKTTCPQCRTELTGGKHVIIPIYSLRKLVEDLIINCEHRQRGCNALYRIEDYSKHVELCGYTPKLCSGCGDVVNRLDFSRHRSTCKREPCLHEREMSSVCQTSTLLFENSINTAEIQLKSTREKLEICEADNRKLKRELLTAKSVLLNHSLTHKEDSTMPRRPDIDYIYGLCPDTISDLSLLIASSLRQKPSHINVNNIFFCIKRSYKKYAWCGNGYEYDVHMLIATAYASNWFTDDQRISLQLWLESIGRYRRYVSMATSLTT